MPNYSRPKSSMPKRSSRSSLHPKGAPGFSETIEGLSRGLASLGSHLAGAATGMAGNLIGPLLNLKKSAGEGDDEAEKAYQEAIAMLRNSGSSSADMLLRDLGERLEEETEEDKEEKQSRKSL